MSDAIKVYTERTPDTLRKEAKNHEEAADRLYAVALDLENRLDRLADEWRASQTRRYLGLLAKANVEQNAAILCRLRALELERGGSA